MSAAWLDAAMSSSPRSAFAAKVRTARLERDWTQGELAARAGLSRGLVSAVECGATEASLESMERIALALDARLVVELTAPLVIGRDDQRDAAHARCVAAVRRELERRGFVCMVEEPFADGRMRGWIDLLALDPASGRLIVVEVKTELRDLGGLLRQVGWYTRRAGSVARDLGWRLERQLPGRVPRHRGERRSARSERRHDQGVVPLPREAAASRPGARREGSPGGD